MVWDDDRIERLKKDWADGYSGSQCATRLGGGLTRAAVIGKVHRLGLSGRTVTNRKVTSKLAAARRYKRHQTEILKFGKVRSRVPIPTEPLPPPHETDIARVSFNDICFETQCKFICTEHATGPYEKQFCGEPRVEGLPYCTVHSQRCYGPPPPRNRLPNVAMGRPLSGHLDGLKEFEETH